MERASRLRLRGVEAGSLVALFGLPVLAARSTEDDGALDLEMDDLAGAAFDKLVAAMTETDALVDRDVAHAVAQLAEALAIGDRHTSLELGSSRGPARAVVDAATRCRMERLSVASAEQRSEVLVGSLREADFDRFTARLHLPSGGDVTVEFAPGLADTIQSALREHTEISGTVTYDAVTSRALRVELVHLGRPEELALDDGFWSAQTVDELATEQGVSPWGALGAATTWTPTELVDLADALAELGR